MTRLHAHLSERHHLSGFPLSAAVSIGAAMAPRNGKLGGGAGGRRRPGDVPRQAVRLGDRVRRDERQPPRRRPRRPAGRPVEAIGTDQIIVHYQPMIRLSDGTVTASRHWCAGTIRSTGRSRPVDFIGMTEQTDLIGPLTESMFRIAVEDLMTLGPRSRSCASTSPPATCSTASSPRTCSSIMHELGFPSDLLELEITERDIVTNSERSALTLARLRDARCPDRDRRLRHRLLVVADPARPARRPDQDRPELHDQHGRVGGRRADRRQGDRDRPRARARRGCRGCRVGRRVATPARARLRPRPGFRDRQGRCRSTSSASGSPTRPAQWPRLPTDPRDRAGAGAEADPTGGVRRDRRRRHRYRRRLGAVVVAAHRAPRPPCGCATSSWCGWRWSCS